MERALQIAELRRQLREQFPQSHPTGRLSLRARLRAGAGPWPTGLEPVDQILPDGGIPGGKLTELCGVASSGKLSLALGCVAAATSVGHLVAWVDPTGTFFPPAAVAAGVDLERLLIVQADSVKASLRAVDILLRGRAFVLVVLDWGTDQLGLDRREEQDLGIAVARLNGLISLGTESLLWLTTPRTARDPIRYYASLRLEMERTPPGVVGAGRGHQPGLEPLAEPEPAEARVELSRQHLRLVRQPEVAPRARALTRRAGAGHAGEVGRARVRLVKNKLGRPGADVEVGFCGWDAAVLPLHPGFSASGPPAG